MTASRGIFETFGNQSSPEEEESPPPASPFMIGKEDDTPAPSDDVQESPFTAAPPESPTPPPKKSSPFVIIPEGNITSDSKPTRIPERRKQEQPSPFQIFEPQGFGYDQVPQGLQVSPFRLAPQMAPAPSQYMMPPAAAPAPSPFGGWHQPAPPVLHPAAQQQPFDEKSSSGSPESIKQLELRAIFGVDREMTREEMMQRARALPGVRKIARVSEADIAAVDEMKKVVSNLEFGNGALKIHVGSAQIEFIREGETLLAVQTDGGFVPGVREALMLVARELGR